MRYSRILRIHSYGVNTTIFFVILLFCVLYLFTLAQPAIDSTTRIRNWKDDLDYLRRELPSKHIDFYKLIPQYDFDIAIAKLKHDIPHISDAEIILRLMRLVASLRIAHTNVSHVSGLAGHTFHRYPIKMQWFSTDLVIVSSIARYKESIGCRVVRIGSMTPKQAETIVAPNIAYENDAHLHHLSPGFMTIVELMQMEKKVDATSLLRLTCINGDGKEFTFDMPCIDLTETGDEPEDSTEDFNPDSGIRSSVKDSRKWVSLEEVFHIPSMLCNKQRNYFYWYEYLPDNQALYIQYNKCLDSPPKGKFGPTKPAIPFEEFTRNLFSYADQRKVQRVIVDLRFNSGGDSSLVNPLLRGLKARQNLCSRGHLYVLTSNRTYSAGMDNAARFRIAFNAILIGEAPGNKPNHYGSHGSFVLPNSKIKVSYSKKYVRVIRNSDPESLEPDILVPRSFADYLAGRDRVLETALHHPLH